MPSVNLDEAMAKAYYSDKKSLALGSQFMAVLWDAIFIGIIFGQTLKYIYRAQHDSLQSRIMVCIALAGCLAATIYTWKIYFEAFVIHFGTYLDFASFDHLGLYALFNGFTIIPIQLIFAERAVKLNASWNGQGGIGSMVLAGWLYTLIAGTIACTIGSVITSRGHTIFDKPHIMTSFYIAQASVCAATHLSLSAAIIFGLLNNKYGSESGSKRTEKLVNRVIMIILDSQIPGTIVSTVVLLLVVVDLKNPFVPFMIIVHPKMYMMGLMLGIWILTPVTLNTRHYWADLEKLHENAHGLSDPFQSRITIHAHSSSSSPDTMLELKNLPSPPPQTQTRVQNEVPSWAEGWETDKKGSATKAMKNAFGKLQAKSKQTRSRSRISIRRKEIHSRHRISESFGPVFSDSRLGSKISFV